MHTIERRLERFLEAFNAPEGTEFAEGLRALLNRRPNATAKQHWHMARRYNREYLEWAYSRWNESGPSSFTYYHY